MPLDLAAALRRHLLQRFPADRAYPRAAFYAEGMPPLVAAFLDRTLDRWVEIERSGFRSDWFDFDAPGVQRAEAPFFDALSRAARIPAEAWEETLGGAVDLVVRFLTMPARALTDAIFEGENAPLPAAEVRVRLSMFDAYPYLAEVATAYLDRKQTETLDPSALFALLDRIDRRVVSEYGREDWLDLLAPLFELARYAPTLDGVPAVRLQRFFQAKDEADLADLLAEHTGSVLDEAQLRDVLAPAFPGLPPAEPEPEFAEPEGTQSEEAESEGTTSVPPAAPDAEEPEALSPSPTPLAPLPPPDVPEPTATPSEPLGPTPVPGDVPDATGEPDDEDPPALPVEAPAEKPHAEEAGVSEEDEGAAVPLWQRFAERTSDGDSVNTRFGTEDTDDDAKPADEAGPPLWKRFFSRNDTHPDDTRHNDAQRDEADVGETAPPTPTAFPSPPSPPAPTRSDSLETLEKNVLGPTSSAQRKRFVKHLFGGDAGKYATVLHTLDGAGSWTEASQIIARDVFRPSRVNIYGEHAVAFTDAVEARFRS